MPPLQAEARQRHIGTGGRAKVPGVVHDSCCCLLVSTICYCLPHCAVQVIAFRCWLSWLLLILVAVGWCLVMLAVPRPGGPVPTTYYLGQNLYQKLLADQQEAYLQDFYRNPAFSVYRC